MTNSAQIRSQLIQALELDLVGPTPCGPSWAWRVRLPISAKAGETVASKVDLMGLGS